MTTLIDRVVERFIRREVRATFESIASDIMDGDEPNADDSFEPVLWHMQVEYSRSRSSRSVFDNSSAVLSDILSDRFHPDYEKFREIAKDELRSYFP